MAGTKPLHGSPDETAVATTNSTDTPQPTAPGRLGRPELKFYEEPRVHPKVLELFGRLRMDGQLPDPTASMTRAQLASSETMARSHKRNMKLYDMLPNELPSDKDEPTVERSETLFTSFDGTERTLYVFRQKKTSSTAPVPAVVYLHGGAMTVGDTANKVHFRWCTSLAARGVIAIAVDFRNAWTPAGTNPFPAGLNDCVAAVRFIHAQRAEWGISSVVLQGESGGANLALATALQAKRQGWLQAVAGVYACAPYISNAYGWSDERKRSELPSLLECDGYFLSNAGMVGMADVYHGSEQQEQQNENPLAWPYFATLDDCTGLPPHVLAMDELDPLRDEGVAYHRKLLAAGVTSTARINLGVPHACFLILRQLLPELHNAVAADIVAFAHGLDSSTTTLSSSSPVRGRGARL